MFEELKTFIAVVDYKNFTKAGEYLNLSQPSVSTHIKNLENYYGVTLVNRSIKHKSIVITENGYKLYKKFIERNFPIVNPCWLQPMTALSFRCFPVFSRTTTSVILSGLLGPHLPASS